jgi:hypothetical protein
MIHLTGEMGHGANDGAGTYAGGEVPEAYRVTRRG